MKRKMTVIIGSLLILSMAGCAEHKAAEKKVDNEMKEASLPKSETVAESARDMITKSKKLTEDQKKKLLSLEEKTYSKNAALQDEIVKAKIVLIQTVLEPKMNKHEYRILKKKIAKLEKERTENGFKAILEARDIIEPKMNAAEDRDFYKAYLHTHLQDY